MLQPRLWLVKPPLTDANVIAVPRAPGAGGGASPAMSAPASVALPPTMSSGTNPALRLAPAAWV